MSDVEAWAVRAVVTAIVAGIAGLFMRMRTTESRVDRLGDKMDRVERDVDQLGDLREASARIEERLKAMPTHRDLEKIHERISETRGCANDTQNKVSEMSADVRGLRASVDRLHKIEVAREGK